ncbi:UDP-N-acetylmuramate--L-alanine ligase [Chitinivibrio alkaliphilus]|uniref:UDP-N-acetylmuramate--L-alanine ligase n=1 Tax=Chitinivibrio alkaliphilus ACht1 TaxID=1313304 RepID=U7D6J8_9BACT|nr:UDP-N-acetylmuramate--L-alanine ligase [Chitinivibrio alkaliphilus]ERP31196.1 UDP-N-acetylmuramate/alanine ligase [Chitinivibrio alkaliphilus ACht1]
MKRNQQIHFIGIGGAGMFPMAEVLHRRGYTVTGSDCVCSDGVLQLRAWGISVQIGHGVDLVRGADLVVYSSAVREDTSELVWAHERGIPTMKRAGMLGDLMRSSFSIGISGTHGKTTTTSIIGSVLESAGYDPTVIVGGVLRGRGTTSGAMVGSGNYLVAEADEYDRSFLEMHPTMAVVTNIEEDHLDIYKDLADIQDAFSQFLHRVPFFGCGVLCIDDPGVRAIWDTLDKPMVTYGYSHDATYRIEEVECHGNESCFSIYGADISLENIVLPLVGRHNIQNGAAAAVVALEMGISPEAVRHGLAEFGGVKRRMEYIGTAAGVSVYDDYAHHPTEITATLSAMAGMSTERLFVVFQPHLYSRTKQLWHEFVTALASDDIFEVLLLPIYGAREAHDPHVDSVGLAHEISRLGKKAYALSVEETPAYLHGRVRQGDHVLLLGAGDVWKLGTEILREIG